MLYSDLCEPRGFEEFNATIDATLIQKHGIEFRNSQDGALTYIWFDTLEEREELASRWESLGVSLRRSDTEY